eukprot:TRINITY_DN4714_c0_g2_i1.p1 TRINITY_DN4714_c0_g2~~TRINITY_DN4714_c0_g2_i1.p1  ORF type:complete len:159 (+),score=43.50 TRINITY_DN4714_c0_g2_i1:112-588(+)
MSRVSTEAVKGVFRKYDPKKQGLIPREMLANILRKVMPDGTSDIDVDALIAEVAKAGGTSEDEVEYDRFVEYILAQDEAEAKAALMGMPGALDVRRRDAYAQLRGCLEALDLGVGGAATAQLRELFNTAVQAGNAEGSESMAWAQGRIDAFEKAPPAT